MQFKDNVYTLKSGRRVYADSGSIGINPALDATDGWEGTLHVRVVHGMTPKEMDACMTFTPEERAEIADYMIGLWQQWKAGAKCPIA